MPSDRVAVAEVCKDALGQRWRKLEGGDDDTDIHSSAGQKSKDAMINMKCISCAD